MANLLPIILAVLGGVGLYLAMPGGRLHSGRAGVVLLAGALAGLLILIVPLAGPRAETIWFGVFAVVALIGALRMITHVKPVYSALYFMLVIVATAGLLILTQATFLAAALLIIYAGAILVTYIFVIMLAQQSGGPASYDRRAREPFLGIFTGFVLLAALSAKLIREGGRSVSHAANDAVLGSDNTLSLAASLLTRYVVGIEIAGVLLLVAMVGAIAIARRKVASAEGKAD
jgi:NADH-quinone oxidoreductase subunit J